MYKHLRPEVQATFTTRSSPVGILKHSHIKRHLPYNRTIHNMCTDLDIVNRVRKRLKCSILKGTLTRPYISISPIYLAYVLSVDSKSAILFQNKL